MLPIARLKSVETLDLRGEQKLLAIRRQEQHRLAISDNQLITNFVPNRHDEHYLHRTVDLVKNAVPANT